MLHQNWNRNWKIPYKFLTFHFLRQSFPKWPVKKAQQLLNNAMGTKSKVILSGSFYPSSGLCQNAISVFFAPLHEPYQSEPFMWKRNNKWTELVVFYFLAQPIEVHKQQTEFNLHCVEPLPTKKRRRNIKSFTRYRVKNDGGFHSHHNRERAEQRSVVRRLKPLISMIYS